MSNSWQEKAALCAAKVRNGLGKSLQGIIEAGQALKEAKEIVPYGEWGNWLKSEFNMSESTGRRYMRVASLLEDEIVNADLSAVYTLTSTVSPELLKICMWIAQNSYLTHSIATAITDVIEKALERDDLLEGLSEDVIEVATVYDVKPEIIPALTQLRAQYPNEFESVARSGAINVDGEAVLLSDANARDFARLQANLRQATFLEANVLNHTSQGYFVVSGADLGDLPADCVVALWIDPANFQATLNNLSEKHGRPLVLMAAIGNPLIHSGSEMIPVDRLNGQAPAWVWEMGNKIV